MESTVEQLIAKSWLKKCIFVLLGCLLVIAILMIIVDPYFHYHKPLSFLSYRLYEERYINDGISRHFDYDAIITGTSMAQNFKTSEMDNLFDTHAVKEPFSGAGYQELCENLDRALRRNHEVKTVIMAVDYNGLLRSYDWSKYESYPTYLYDDTYLNDAPYLWNKSILYHGTLNNVAMSLQKETSTTMDEYSAWTHATGLEHVLGSYDRQSLAVAEDREFDELDREMVTKTVESNIVKLVNKYPNTTFYLFYTPYSICYWDALSIEGMIEKQMDAEKLATELLLQCSNVKLYNFFDKTEIICDLDYYNDLGHYSAEVNSMILQWMAEGSGLVTQDNSLDRLKQERQFFLNYNYDAIYE